MLLLCIICVFCMCMQLASVCWRLKNVGTVFKWNKWSNIQNLKSAFHAQIHAQLSLIERDSKIMFRSILIFLPSDKMQKISNLNWIELNALLAEEFGISFIYLTAFLRFYYKRCCFLFDKIIFWQWDKIIKIVLILFTLLCLTEWPCLRPHEILKLRYLFENNPSRMNNDKKLLRDKIDIIWSIEEEFWYWQQKWHNRKKTPSAKTVSFCSFFLNALYSSIVLVFCSFLSNIWMHFDNSVSSMVIVMLTSHCQIVFLFKMKKIIQIHAPTHAVKHTERKQKIRTK